MISGDRRWDLKIGPHLEGGEEGDEKTTAPQSVARKAGVGFEWGNDLAKKVAAAQAQGLSSHF